MTTGYLQMDGADDTLKTPPSGMTNLTEFVMDFMIDVREDWHQFANFGGRAINFQSNTNNLIFHADYKQVYVDGVIVTSGTPFITIGQRHVIHGVLKDGINTGSTASYFFTNTISQFVKGRIYDVKLYQGTTLKAHWDMSTGTVNDRTLYGNNGVLVGGTWVDIGEQTIGSVTAVPDSLELALGENRKVAPVAVPASYTSQLENYFESGNEGFFTVTQDGVVTGVNAGESQLMVRSTYEDKVFTNFVPVSVAATTLPPPTSTRTVNGIALNYIVNSLEVGEHASVEATTLPFDVFNDNIVVWETSNPAICSVKYGVIKGVSPGTVTITAKDASGVYSDSFTVTVEAGEIYNVPAEVYGIKLDNTDAVNTTNGIQAAMNYASANGYKKIVFPFGTYLITPEARTIEPPTEMVIDFSRATLNIAPNSLSPTGYVMFRFINVSHTEIIGMKLYGEADSIVSIHDAHETCVNVEFDKAYKSGLRDCSISKSPGFNIVGTHRHTGDQVGRHPSKNDWEAGRINDTTGLPDNSILANHFRTNRFLNVSGLGNDYVFAYTQAYFGYPFLRSRLYSIYWYDAAQALISVQKYGLQGYVYDKPAGAVYAKIVIYQEAAPTAHDTDFSAVAMLRTWTMPVKCFIINCDIEDNTSCGLAITGGRSWNIQGNRFNRNGLRAPLCDVDWEDGWTLSTSDICRDNTFTNRVVISGGQTMAIVNNTFNGTHLQAYGATSNFRILNNVFDGLGKATGVLSPLSCQAESYFAGNILVQGAEYTKAIQHSGASYQVRDINNTVI